MPRHVRRMLIQGFTLLAIGIGMLGIDVLDYVYSPVRAHLAQELSFELTPGQTLHTLANQLYQQGCIDSPLRLRLYGRWRGVDRHLQAGEYVITPTTTPGALLAQFTQGRVKSYKLSIIEGWNARQLAQAVAEQPRLERRQFAYEQLLKYPAIQGPSLEGLLFPDTYFYTPGQDDVASVLEKAHTHLLAWLAPAWQGRDPTLPITTPYDALIVASLIEKETAAISERPLVAAVIYNRLRKGMRLQIDPTVIYALGKAYTGKLHKADLSLDSPYNTYRHKGLPPTPIAFSSESSLLAALHPAHSDVLYFVARGNGQHAFSSTLPDHNQHVTAYVVQLHSH